MAKASKKEQLQSSVLEYVYNRYVGDDPKSNAEYDEEVLNAEIARRVYDLCTKAGISQRELAKRVKTSASAICRFGRCRLRRTFPLLTQAHYAGTRPAR